MKRHGVAAIAAIAAIASSLVLALGLVALWTPLSTDQAIFTYGARTMVSGETLYVDFWDVKPPGIFYFYAVAGLSFGFGEPGLHLLELLWLLAASVVMVWIAARAVDFSPLAIVAPAASIGFYLLFAGADHRTQVEALMVLPLMLGLAATAVWTRNPRAAGWGFAMGAAAGVVSLFKPVYLPLPVAFALVGLVVLTRRQGLAAARHLPRLALLSAFGALTVWLPVLGHFAAHEAVGELLWTTFQYPREALVDYRAPLARLGDSFAWMAGVLWPWLPLAALGLVPRRHEPEPVLRWGAVVYLCVAAGLIAVQTISWWPYHFVLLFPPVGLLACFGVDRLLSLGRRLGGRRLAVAAVAALALAAPGWLMVRQTAETVRRLRAAAAVDTDAELALRLDPLYWQTWEATRDLREGGRPGTIYVFGDMRILLLSGRRQAMPVHGHGWELFPDSLWSRLPAELMAARPTYVYVTPYNREVLAARAPELVADLDRRYVPVRLIGRGVLLALKP